MAVEKVNTQMQLVTEYINIFGIIIQLNLVNLVKRRRKLSKQIIKIIIITTTTHVLWLKLILM
jgi:hypothetical protein